MYAGDLLESLQWDTLYHEHLTFYCLTTLEVLLGRHSFHIVDAERIPMHGGSLRVVATPNERASVQPSVARVLEYEKGKRLADPATWLAFGKQAHHKIQVAAQTFGHLSHHNKIWAYGAAGKATMWVNACKMNYLQAVVDASPLRAGKLMPGTHTPIVYPEELKKNPPDYVFVTAWNYVEYIRAKENWYQGIWSVPLPELRFF
jgi:novobiocin biosynthesis protein NovU/D-mycarose 3-C-methyltransferase